MADRRERANDPVTALQVAFQGMQSELWTVLPGAVVAYNTPDKPFRTCSVQPLIQAGIRGEEEMEWINLPILADCPVVFPGGGGYSLTFPLKPGDEGLILISSRCIDAWWEAGGIQPQMELRMHDLSDGFFLPGIESKPMLTPMLSATDVQLRSKDGTTYIGLGPAGVSVQSLMPVSVNSASMVNITSTMSIALVAPLITANGVPLP